MAQSVLGSLFLGYRPLWNAARRLAGVQLFVRGDAGIPVDALHLLRTIGELWSASSTPLLLAPRSPEILADWLAHAPAGAPAIEVTAAWLADPALLERARGAHRRGLKLVWRGPLSHLPDPETAALFETSLLSLDGDDAMAALQVARLPRAQLTPGANPIIAGQIYEGVASRALLAHCLDGSAALALADWPTDDVLHGLRPPPLQPSHEVVLRFLKAIDEEQSIDGLEQILGEDPLLAYRFMVHTNSAALGLRTGVDSLRRGLLMMGFGAIGRWLGEMLPLASTAQDLRPIRESMVLRARLAQQLIDAGAGKELRSEVYLCALFLRLDALLDEPLGVALRRLPLSGRVYDGAVQRTGPYAPSLEMALALEGDDPTAVRRLCEAHDFDREQVNRSLLHVLRTLVVPRPHPN